MPRALGLPIFLLSLPCLVACAEPSWSVESESLSGSLTLLDGATQANYEFVADTSHRGRVRAVVTLPGVALPTPEPTPDVDVPTSEVEQASEPSRLVVAELSLDEAHSLVRLPGSGGELSVPCPGDSCAGDVAQLLVRALDDADLGSRGVTVNWSVFAETFGSGDTAPADAQAMLSASE